MAYLTYYNSDIYTNKQFTSLSETFSGQTGPAGIRKVNHSGFWKSKRWWNGRGISWTICKSPPPWSKQITMHTHGTSSFNFTGWIFFYDTNSN